MAIKDVTPQIEIIPMKEKVVLIEDTEIFGQGFGGLRGNATSIQQGSGNEIYRVDYRGLLLGAADFVDAPFSVSMAGALTATSATIAGTITATAGVIGGFNIGADYIRDVANSMGMASTVTGGDDVRFWAGASFANRATAVFNVDEAGNTTVNSLRRKDFHWFTLFESIDGYGKSTQGTGSFALSGGNGIVSITGTVSGNENELQKIVYNSGVQAFNWDKSKSGKFSILVQANMTNHEMWIAVGVIQSSTNRHIGFKMINGAVSGTVANGTTESSVALISLSNNQVYVLEYYYNYDEGVVYFYVGGTLYGSVNTNIPTGLSFANWLLNWTWKTTTTAAKEMYLSFIDLWQSN